MSTSAVAQAAARPHLQEPLPMRAPIPPARGACAEDDASQTTWGALTDRLTEAERVLLMVRFSGRRLQLPRRFDPASEICRQMAGRLGPELARKVCEALPGETIEVPNRSTLEQEQRNMAIRRLARIADVPTIAEALGMTERQVRRIVTGN